MKNSFTLLALSALVAGSCHRPLGPYRDTDKWLLNAEDDRRQFSDHPKEIAEYNYKASETEKPGKRRMLYDRYGFNADGDIVWGNRT
jgi:hypothetical protein